MLVTKTKAGRTCGIGNARQVLLQGLQRLADHMVQTKIDERVHTMRSDGVEHAERVHRVLQHASRTTSDGRSYMKQSGTWRYSIEHITTNMQVSMNADGS